MKLSNLLTIATILFFATACGDTYYEDYYGDEGYYEEEAYYKGGEFAEEGFGNFDSPNSYNAQTINSNGGNLKMHPVRDPKTGMIGAHVPLPANWKVTPQGIFGPNGTEIKDMPGATFSSQQRRVSSIDQIIREDILPKMQQAGSRFVNTFDLPEIAEKDRQTFSQYWKAMPSQETHQVKGVEFKDAQGKSVLLVVHFTYSRSQYGDYGFYYINALSARPEQYEKAKSIAIYALANLKISPQAIAAHNQREQQKSNASWSAHNQKMRRNQANFDSWNRANRNTYNEISDINMQGWRNRNAISVQGHSKSIDGIWERESIIDPYTGNQMKAQSGYSDYYMNNQGEYIGTNDKFYNPERDPRMNNQNWRKARRQGNGY